MSPEALTAAATSSPIGCIIVSVPNTASRKREVRGAQAPSGGGGLSGAGKLPGGSRRGRGSCQEGAAGVGGAGEPPPPPAAAAGCGCGVSAAVFRRPLQEAGRRSTHGTRKPAPPKAVRRGRDCGLGFLGVW